MRKIRNFDGGGERETALKIMEEELKIAGNDMEEAYEILNRNIEMYNEDFAQFRE